MNPSNKSTRIGITILRLQSVSTKFPLPNLDGDCLFGDMIKHVTNPLLKRLFQSCLIYFFIYNIKIFDNLYDIIMILSNKLIRIGIIIPHQQNVNIKYLLLTLSDDYLFDGMLIHVINLLLKRLFLS